jgi:hypothetical protein
MKKFILFFVVGISALVSNAQSIATFDDLPLGADTFWNGSNLSGGFPDGKAFFENQYDTSFGGFWGGGFIYSDVKNDTTAGYTDEYAAITDGGFSGSQNYAVAYDNGNANVRVGLSQNAYGGVVSGFYVTNSTYAYLSMKNGDAFEHAFMHDSGDYFLLQVTGWLNGSAIPDTINFYLADFRDTINNYIVNTWQWVDLTPLGDVDSLVFEMHSSQAGTPSYFCMDNFTTTDLADQFITITYEEDTLIEVVDLYTDTTIATPPYTLFISAPPRIPGASALIDSNRIWYIPTQGVVATDTVGYTICGTNNVCDNGQVIINITGIQGINNISTNQSAVYPNPCTNSFNVFNAGGLKEIRLYDMEGRIVNDITCNIGDERITVNTGDLPAGAYIVKMISEQNSEVAKIIKQ